MYSDNVMDHFKNPRNVDEIENADGVGEVGNPLCGDIMKTALFETSHASFRVFPLTSSVLAEEGFHNAINDYRKKKGLEPWIGKNPHLRDHSENLKCEH